MFKIYKKCEKSVDNPYGILEISNINEITKPFLLCISPRINEDNSTFGIIKEGARSARVRTSDELAGGFKIDDMNVDFLGVKFDFSESSDNNNLCDDFIYPLLLKDKDLFSIKKRARRINFFLYCNAVKMYVEIEKKLVKRLTDDGFNNNEIKEILSQISVVSIASQIDIKDLFATSIMFKDVNDTDVFDYYSRVASRKMDDMLRDSYISRLKTNGNAIGYIFNGKGYHELKSYFDEENIVKSSLCACVCKLLENSILNEQTDDFIPISSKYILPTITKYNSEFKDCKQLLYELDNSIKYGNVGRYTSIEHEEIKENEKEFKKMNNNDEIKLSR